MKNIAIAGLIVFATLSTAGNAYLGYRLISVPKIIQPVDQAAVTIAAVSKLVELPEGQVPTVATVEDPEVLKKQGLFPTAQKGDIVLVYPEEKKAILYRPSTNKVIEISVVNITNEEPTKENTTPTPAPAPAPEPAPAPTPAPVTP